MSALIKCLVCAMSVVMMHSAIAADNLSYSFSVESRYDDNVGLAPDQRSKRDTRSHRLSGSVSWQVQQTSRRSLSVSAQPFYEAVDSLEDLSNWGVLVEVSGQQQFSDAFTAPFVSVDLQARWRQFKNSQIRDGYGLEGDIAVGRQFGPRLGVRAGARFRLHEASDDEPVGTLAGARSDEVNDHKAVGGFVKVDYNLQPKTSVFVEYSYMTGDVAATGDALAFNNPEAFDSARDFAFEEGTAFLSWRIDADQHTYAAGVRHEFTTNVSVQATASFIDAKGEFDNDYQNEVFTVGVTWKF